MKTMFPIVHLNIAGYQKDVKRKEKRNTYTLKQNKENPDVLSANGHDICNYVARYRLGDFQIQAVMKLDGRLDFLKLSKAVRLSIDVEPVLGCRFVECKTPYWRRLDKIEESRLCSMEETDNLDEAVQQFIESPLDMDKDLMVKVKLFRSGPNDTLCVKVNHSCSDARGTKEYIQLLSEIYSHICYEEGVFILEPSNRDSKDHERLFNKLGIKNPGAPWNPPPETPVPNWKFPWKNGHSNSTRIAVCRLAYGQFDEISMYAKSKGATINDLLLTAFYRAMFKMSKPMYGVPKDISLTIDLRRYLPDQKAEAIRNLSGGIVTRLARRVKEPFEGTLSRVMRVMNKVKKGNPGIENALAAERVEKLNYRKTRAYFNAAAHMSEIMSLNPFNYMDKCAPTLSNFGFVSKKILIFGDNDVTDAYMVPPVIRAPGFLLAVSTYNGEMTLSAGYYKDSVQKNHIEKLLNKIRDELVAGCKQKI